jgi:predicted RNase H-like nuclease (RuvC/YqgF family)
MGMMDEAWRESVKRSPKEEKNMTATFTVGEKDMMQKDMKELTKSYYEALTRIKELIEKIEELKNEVESLKGDKVELRSIRGH